jgi:glycosyltransferase involved in cell wall biosynthesis
MRVLLNNLTGVRQKTGIGHYITELVRTLRVQHQEHQFVTFPGPWVEAGARAWRRLHQGLGNVKRRCFGGGTSKAGDGRLRIWLNARARAWAAWHFRTFRAGRPFDLYHEPNNVPFPCDRPTVATIHDLSALLFPQWHPADRVAHYAQHFEPGLKRCVHLLADSEFTRRELIEHFHVAPDKVTFVPLGMRADLRPMAPDEVRPILERLGMPGQYLLHVGTIEPRKNLLTLMRAYCDLPSAARERCPLVLVGGWGWNVTEAANFYHGTARHQQVRHLGYVADGELPALYNGARALVLPTHYEGFGLPPLEMLACGGAVIASTAGAVVETVGRQAHIVAPLDVPGWRDAMHRVIADDDWRDELRRGGQGVARPYTWKRCAAETLRIYASALGRQLASPLAA